MPGGLRERSGERLQNMSRPDTPIPKDEVGRDDLLERLREAEETLGAIRSGEVDALVVGDRVYALEETSVNSSRFRGEVLSQISESVIATDADGRVIFINEAAEDQYRTTPDDALGSPQPELFTVEWLSDEDEEQFEEALAENKQWRGENVHVRRDGSTFFAESAVCVRLDRDKNPIGHLTVVREITERKAAEEELRRSHETFHNLVANTPFGIYVIDADFRIITVSKGSRKVFENVDPLIGRDFGEVLTAIWAEPFATNAIGIFRHTLETGEPYESHNTTEPRSDIDETESYDWRIERILLPDGRFGVVCYFYDLSERLEFERLLRSSEERLRLIVESVSEYAIFTTDRFGTVTSWNAGAERIFGYDRDEMLEMSAERLFTSDDNDAGALAADLKSAAAGTNVPSERWMLRGDGSRFYASGVVAKVQQLQPETFVIIIRDQTDRVEAERARRQQEVLQNLVKFQESERHRIARDLHDHLGQQLTGLRLALANLSETSDPATATRIDEIQQLAINLDRDMSLLAFELRTTHIEESGIADALEKFVGDWSETYGIAAEVRVTQSSDKRLDRDTETNLYRIAQEALNNVLKHANAQNVSVMFENVDGHASLIIEDDGRGFKPAARSRSKRNDGHGLGLIGMRERVALLEGTVQIESNPGEGTTVFVRVPTSGRR